MQTLMTLQNLNRILDRYELEIGISKNEEKMTSLKGSTILLSMA